MANLDKRNKENLRHSIDRLGKQLISYQIIDFNDIVAAKVIDIERDHLDNVYLLVQLIDRTADSNWYQLSERDIEQIDSQKRTIKTNLSLQELAKLPPAKALDSSLSSEYETFPLLEEKLTVKRYRRKVGEIVVRKQIETRMVQIPIRSEKLIVERVGDNPEVLSEAELGTERVFLSNSPELAASFKSKFVSIQAAEQILQALKQEGWEETKVRLEIITDDETQRNAYQSVCDRFS